MKNTDNNPLSYTKNIYNNIKRLFYNNVIRKKVAEMGLKIFDKNKPLPLHHWHKKQANIHSN
ncbi:MAG: hypothetical protein K5787_18055 [Lentisphaeria bacterium]|nr:hypothetical protein [Lentisphaeria bacterium]